MTFCLSIFSPPSDLLCLRSSRSNYNATTMIKWWKMPGWMLNVEGWMNNARPVHQSTAVLQLTLCASVVARMNAECWRVDEYCKTSLFNRRLKPGVHAYVRDFPVVGTWRSVFRRDRVFWNEHKIWNAVTYWIAAATFNPFSATLIALLEEFPFKNILKYESQRR